MKKTPDSVRAKISRHSNHLLNRLLGWRYRGSRQEPNHSSAVEQNQPTTTRQHDSLSSAVQPAARESPATDILFSTVPPTMQDDTVKPTSDKSFKGAPAVSTTDLPSDRSAQNLTGALEPSSTVNNKIQALKLVSSSKIADLHVTTEVPCPIPSSSSAALPPPVINVLGVTKSLPTKQDPFTNDSSSIQCPTTVVDAAASELTTTTYDVAFKAMSAGVISSAASGSAATEDPSDMSDPTIEQLLKENEPPNFGEPVFSEREMTSSFPSSASASPRNNLTANFDQRYGGQYLAPEQLPEFCNQLHQLVEMIRNIQSYSITTGEYPSALERRLACEAREVAALAAEVRNARDSVDRARAQRRAVRALRRDTFRHLAALREEEMRELETTVRAADRKLFKSWECLKEAHDVRAFDSLMAELKGKQNALSCLSRLIDNRCATLGLVNAGATAAPRATLPPLLPPASSDQSPRSRYFPSKRPFKRKKRERDLPSHSVPVSNDPSQHSTDQSSSRIRPSSICTIANQRLVNMNPMSVPYELISQSGIPANMLPSMGSNSNHNLTLNGQNLPAFVPFRFSARQFVPTTEIRVTSSDRDTVGDMVFMRIDDRSTD